MQARHVWSRQYRHSKIHQCGPEWHRWHVHSISVLSDLIMTNECAQWLASAISTLVPWCRPSLAAGIPGVVVRAEAKAGLAGCWCAAGAPQKGKSP